jgi:flagellar hook-length control protein FliK
MTSLESILNSIKTQVSTDKTSFGTFAYETDNQFSKVLESANKSYNFSYEKVSEKPVEFANGSFRENFSANSSFEDFKKNTEINPKKEIENREQKNTKIVNTETVPKEKNIEKSNNTENKEKIDEQPANNIVSDNKANRKHDEIKNHKKSDNDENKPVENKTPNEALVLSTEHITRIGLQKQSLVNEANTVQEKNTANAVKKMDKPPLKEEIQTESNQKNKLSAQIVQENSSEKVSKNIKHDHHASETKAEKIHEGEQLKAKITAEQVTIPNNDNSTKKAESNKIKASNELNKQLNEELKATVTKLEVQNEAKNSSNNNQHYNNHGHNNEKINIKLASVGGNEIGMPNIDLEKNIQFGKILETNQPKAATPTPVADQVIDKIKNELNNGKSQISMTLNPEKLGKVNIDLASSRGQLTAQITAENTQVKELLIKSLETLRQTLQDQGINVNNIVVKVQEPTPQNNSQDQFQFEQNAHKFEQFKDNSSNSNYNSSSAYNNNENNDILPSLQTEEDDNFTIKTVSSQIVHNGSVDYTV